MADRTIHKKKGAAMSALETLTDTPAIDSGHRLDILINLVKPHVSHLGLKAPSRRKVITLRGETEWTIHEPLSHGYIITKLGLARAGKRFLIFTKIPELLGHNKVTEIEPNIAAQLIVELTELLNRQINVFYEI